jgi:hypothetical protein
MSDAGDLVTKKFNEAKRSLQAKYEEFIGTITNRLEKAKSETTQKLSA